MRGPEVGRSIGKGQFIVVSKLLRLMGKRPVILADADALTDDLELAHFVLDSESANVAAANLGAGSAITLSNNIHNDFCHMADNSWASIENKASTHLYWVEREEPQNEDQQRAKRRSAFSTLFILTDEAVQALEQGQSWLSIKQRLETLLNLLEEQGCFVLRKGSIESYFTFNDEQGTASKLEMATVEAAGLNDANAVQVRGAYEDVVRCLEFASDAENIVEAEALQDAILAISAPALAKIREALVT